MDLLRTVKNQVHLLQAIIAVVRFGFPAKKLTIIGVTGTDGKTTTSTLIYHFLKAFGYKVALISTVAAYIGDNTIDTGFHVTSPNSNQLQRLLRQIVDLGYTHVVLESTSHGLDQHRLFGTWMKTAVVTNVTHEHLDYHKTFANYLTAKAKLFQHATSVIINHDDEGSYETLKMHIKPQTRWIAYSLSYADTRNFPFTNEEYDLLLKASASRFSEPYNQLNTLAAAIASYIHGVSFQTIVETIDTFPGVPGRMQEISNGHGFRVIVDFAHTPNAIKRALEAVRLQTKGHIIAIFGAAGARDASKRPMMGNVASELADEVIVTSEDPRFENPRCIIQQIKSGATQKYGHIHGVIDRRLAIRFGLKMAKPNDIVIICGKGHERSLNMDGIHELPWSDVDVVSEELANL